MVECNRGCGHADLHWKVINNQYKLFGNDGLLHICNDGVISNRVQREKVTGKILAELGVNNAKEIPSPDIEKKEHRKEANLWMRSNDTGDDKHNAIYLPRVAVPELIKALVDFI